MATKKISLGVVFGGVSSEYEISLKSAYSILNNIDNEKYDIFKIGITKGGEFYLYSGEISLIETDQWHGDECVPCIISPDRNHHGLLILGETLSNIKLDCIFPVLHGKNGEDGTIQGLLEMANIPYVGCDVLSSACCMDKAITKTLLDSQNIANSKWLFTDKSKYGESKDSFLAQVEQELKFPCFVKPANAGSSVGISKPTDKASLEKAISLAFDHDKKVIVEELIVGAELECAVLGNNKPIASVLGEIEPCNDFYDYDAKYISETKTFIPARIDEAISEEIRMIALEAYKLLGCSGLSRIDFFLTKDNKIILNEMNTLPGFTQISMYSQLFNACGLPYADLIDELVTLAINKFD